MTSDRSDRALARRLVLDARPYWPHIAGSFLLALAATPVALLVPVPLKIAVDSVVASDPLPSFLEPLVPGFLDRSAMGMLAFAAILVVAVELAGKVQKMAASLLETYTSEQLVLDLQARLFRHAQTLPFTYHDAKGSPDSIYRIQHDTSCISDVALNGVVPLARAVFTLAAMLYVMVRLDWQLALVAVAISPLLVVFTLFYKGQLRRRWREVKEIESAALGVVQEVLTSLRVVLAFGQERREQERFVKTYREGMRARLRLLVAKGLFGVLLGLTTAGGTAAVLYIGVSHVLAGTLTLGSFLLVMTYVGQLYGPLWTLGKQVTGLQKALAGAERVYSFLDREPEVRDRPDGRRLARAEGRVSFRDVTFAYGDEEPVLRGFDLEVAAGTRVGIAGETGVGKSTLLGLLTRFFDPDEGAVLLDGVDLREYRLGDLRDQFAIVQQDTLLFSSSVAENIAYGQPGASREEIEEAARAADIHDFLLTLPDGYATQVGERGMRLSGGERQRIALARAFLKDAPILILDEPTSALDRRTETSVLDATTRLMEDRTTFVVSHRESALAYCDQLVILGRGSVAVSTREISTALDRLRTSSTGTAEDAGPGAEMPEEGDRRVVAFRDRP